VTDLGDHSGELAAPNVAGHTHERPDDWLAQALVAKPGDKLLFSESFEDAEHLLGEVLQISIHPSRLTLQLADKIEVGGRMLSPVNFFLGFGDWSPWLQPISERRVYREAQQILRRKGAFRLTTGYINKKAAIEAGKTFTINHVSIDNIEKLDDYYRNYRQMIRRAREEGIVARPKTILSSALNADDVNSARPLWAEVAERNVGIAIDRDGSLHRLGPGQHRTAVAQLLKLSTMPCEVRCIHGDWLRRLIADTGLQPLGALAYGLDKVRQTPSVNAE
jgi:hypothetical protein